jgi:hypothetical protein
MEKMNFKQIMDVLKDKIESVHEFAYGDFGERMYPDAKYGTPEYESRTLPELGEIKEVEQVGGEGEGDHWHSVKYFVEHDIYIYVKGWYSSYNGTDFYDGWDCCSEVRPQEKTITVYC